MSLTNKVVKKFMVCGAALLMLASAGAASSNVVNVNAKHVRTHRVVRHHRRHSRKAVKRYNHKRNVHKYNVHKLNHRKNARKWRARHHHVHSHKQTKLHLGLGAVAPESSTKAYKEAFKLAYHDPQTNNTLTNLLKHRNAFNKAFYDGAVAGYEKYDGSDNPNDGSLGILLDYEPFAKRVLNNKDAIYRQGAWDNSTDNTHVSPRYYNRNDYKSAWEQADNWGLKASNPNSPAEGSSQYLTNDYNWAMHNTGLD